MPRSRPLIVAAVVIGVLLIVVAVVYWIDSAKDLPSFFPGHDAGSTHVHFKHGLAAAIVGLGCFVFAWFQTGGAPERNRAT